MLRQFVRNGMGAFAVALLAAAVPFSLQAQVGQIVGTITHGDTGEPMSAVQLSVTGTGLGVVSGADGTFTISNVPAGTHVVQAQRLGFQVLRQEGVTVTAGQSTTLNLVLRPTVLALQQIVATGLVDPVEGARSPISVARVTREMMPVAVAGNAVQNLQGRVAGLSMNRGSGEPGSGVSIMLRSPTSLRGSGSPLIVVDGVILGGVIGDANTTAIEGMDIESIEVIRGAAASSLYGSRAASGVIAITTARGSSLEQGRTQFSARSEVGFTQAASIDDLPSHHQYYVTADGSSWADAAGNPVERANRVPREALPIRQFMDQPYPGPVYDNLSAVLQPGVYQAHQFSLSQNTASTNFAISLSRTQEGGAIDNNDGYYRNSVRINLDHRFLDALSLGTSMNYVNDGRQNTAGNVFSNTLNAPRDIDLSRKDPATGLYIQQPDPTVQYQNPLWFEQVRENDTDGFRFLGSASLRWDPWSWMTASGLVSFDRRDQETRAYVAKGTPASVPNDTGEELDGSISFTSTRTATVNAEGSLSLRRDLGLLNTRITFRGLMERDRTETGTRSGSGFVLYGLPHLSNIPADNRNAASTERDRRALGYLVDLAFDYDAKYVLTVLGRRDGSSLFGPDDRWHNYYRLATAWRLSEEDWFNFQNIGEFKLSYARGTAGGTPGWDNQYETWQLVQGVPSKSQLGNRRLRPEHTIEQEVSLDMIVAETWGIELTHAWQTTSEQIVPAPQPAYSGYNTQWVNAGVVKGHTTEVTVEAQLMQRANLGWNSLFIADYSDAKIADWPLPCDAVRTWRFDCTGEPVYGIYGHRLLQNHNQLSTHRDGDAVAFADQFQVNDEGYLVWVGDFDYTDGMVNGVITPGTWGSTSGDIGGRTYQWGVPFFEQDASGSLLRPALGTGAAVNLGWINNLRLGNFNFHAQLHASLGGVTNNRGFQDLINNGSTNFPGMDQSGKPDGLKKPIGYYTGAVGSGGSTYITETANYVKLRTLSVNYRFSQNQLQTIGLGGIGVQSMQLGLVGRNIFTLTDYSGWDPEQGLDLNNRLNSAGLNTYPSTRQLTAEVAVTF